MDNGYSKEAVEDIEDDGGGGRGQFDDLIDHDHDAGKNEKEEKDPDGRGEHDDHDDGLFSRMRQEH